MPQDLETMMKVNVQAAPTNEAKQLLYLINAEATRLKVSQDPAVTKA